MGNCVLRKILIRLTWIVLIMFVEAKCITTLGSRIASRKQILFDPSLFWSTQRG